MVIRFKKLSDKAVAPFRANPADAGYDLTATKITTEIDEVGKLVIVYHTDIAVEIPEGYVGFLMPRSSITKKSLALANSIGVIDSPYRGEIIGKFKTTTDVIPSVYKEGERFAQLIIIKVDECEYQESEELSSTERGEGGFGSSDEKTAEQAA